VRRLGVNRSDGFIKEMNLVPEKSIVDRLQVFYLPMHVQSVVSWCGSFVTGVDLADGEEILQELLVSLLDKGTQHKNRFEIGGFLENRGARLGFRSDGRRCSFSGKALREDVGDVMGVMYEILTEPLLDTEEFEKAKGKLTSVLRRASYSTDQRAAIALSQLLYDQHHPNYLPTFEQELDTVASITHDQLVELFHTRFLSRDIQLVVTGDLDVGEHDTILAKLFTSWSGEERHIPQHEADRGKDAETAFIPLADRDNLDVRMGHTVDLKRDDPAYVPLLAGVFALGGNFSARLMTEVRDEQGLTYGIGSSLVGCEPENNGHFQVAVTLSKENLERGIAATKDVVGRFVEEGVDSKELERQKEAIAGAYKVRLSTTSGAARALLHSVERNLGEDYLVRFHEQIRILNVQGVNDAITRYLQPDRLCEAIAGTLPDSDAALA